MNYLQRTAERRQMIYNQHAQLESYGLQTRVKEHRKNDVLKLIPCPNCGRKKLYKDGHYVECQHCGYWQILSPGQDF